MKVFISSVIRGLEQFRAAARDGILQAGMQPVSGRRPRAFSRPEFESTEGLP